MKKIISIFLSSLLFSAATFAQSALDDFRFSVNEYQVIGDNPLGQKAYAVLEPFVGDQFGLEGLSAAADALEQALINDGYSFHRVNLPPQELLSGSVILEVVEFKIGQVTVTGNQFFNSDNIRRSIPGLIEGKAPNTTAVAQSVKSANTHASKSVVLRFNEGESPNSIDATLTVTDRNPSSFFITLDNSGGHDTVSERVTLGYQNSNVFNKDHALTLTLTTAPENTEAVSQFGLSYQIPFYSQSSRFNILLSNSESNTGEVADNNLVTGKGSVLGLNYSQSIFLSSSVDHSVSIGLTYKLFDNTQVNTNAKVLSLPLELAYHFSSRSAQTIISGGITLASNIESGDENTDETYAVARTNATTKWSAVRYQLAMDYVFAKDWLLHMDLSGQSSSDSLISGEQFGVGGSNTVRGFEERSINGDEGQTIRAELWMPALTSYQIRWLIFADQAHVELKETNATSNDGLDEDVASVGLGLRWSWKQQLSVNADYGKITKEGGADTSINRKDDTKAHIGLVYRF